MERFLAECIADTTIQDIEVGQRYCVEHEIDYKIIYNETKTTFESVVGNMDWFYSHFKPLCCVACRDRHDCRAYDKGRDRACYGYAEEKVVTG